MIALLLSAMAWATPAYDPADVEATFTGPETFDATGELKLWSAVERHHDPDPTLFTQDDFTALVQWPDTSDYAPYIGRMFGDATPHAGTFLLHMGPGLATAQGTPVLFVHGAGDNGSRGFSIMAANVDRSGRPTFAVTFAHPHGDVFEQAEVVADAISAIKAKTGADEVDVVAHSKGGISAVIYASNLDDSDWGNPAYDAVGTRYRGDVRNLVLIATPLGGIDTAFRWTTLNYLALDPDTALSPSSWESYYPSGSAAWWFRTDLTEQDFLAGGRGDAFPGQRQLVARQDHPLPGEQPWLGAYALQQDWYTTYEGGYGFYSYSPGIDAVAEAGGDVIATLRDEGVHPDVAVHLLAGDHPVMPNGTEQYLTQQFGEVFVDLLTGPTDAWAELVADIAGETWEDFGVPRDELQGLIQGKLVLGEITGPSDGLVFVDSALDTSAVTGRGAEVVTTDTRALSHIDLLNASLPVAAILRAQAEANPTEDGWKAAIADRYEQADTIGWLLDRLADPDDPDPGGDTGDPGDTGDVDTSSGRDDDPDTADPDDDDDSATAGADGPEEIGGCTTAPSPLPLAVGWGVVGLVVIATRRRRAA